jgi:hypothetical protein
MALATAVSLLVHYCHVGEDQAWAEVLAWAGRYSPNWVRMAVIEALYQGRYKLVSVDYILTTWQRLGKTRCHFNREFEAITSVSLSPQIRSKIEHIDLDQRLKESASAELPPIASLVQKPVSELSDTADELSIPPNLPPSPQHPQPQQPEFRTQASRLSTSRTLAPATALGYKSPLKPFSPPSPGIPTLPITGPELSPQISRTLAPDPRSTRLASPLPQDSQFNDHGSAGPIEFKNPEFKNPEFKNLEKPSSLGQLGEQTVSPEPNSTSQKPTPQSSYPKLEDTSIQPFNPASSSFNFWGENGVIPNSLASSRSQDSPVLHTNNLVPTNPKPTNPKPTNPPHITDLSFGLAAAETSPHGQDDQAVKLEPSSNSGESLPDTTAVDDFSSSDQPAKSVYILDSITHLSEPIALAQEQWQRDQHPWPQAHPSAIDQFQPAADPSGFDRKLKAVAQLSQSSTSTPLV